MSKFIFIAFPNEALAYDGTRALEALDAEGSLTLYGMAVVAKSADGTMTVKKDSVAGPLGVAVGALAGGFIGLLGGPVGAVLGAGTGALLGTFSDLSNLGLSGEYLREIAGDLTPGKVAVVAEVSEDWVTPLDSRMDKLGGVVRRVGRAYVEDELSQREMAAMKTELSQLHSEYQHAQVDGKAKLKARIEAVEAKAQTTSDRMHQRLTQLRQETEAKLAALQAQFIKATGDAKEKISQRIAELRADDERRARQLEQAWGLTKKALA